MTQAKSVEARSEYVLTSKPRPNVQLYISEAEQVSAMWGKYDITRDPAKALRFPTMTEAVIVRLNEGFELFEVEVVAPKQ